MKKRLPKEHLPEIIDKKSLKRDRAQKEKQRPIFFGFGMFGMIGWTIAVPAVIGIFIGRWLDGRHLGSTTISWTLTCLFTGLFIGGVAAWHWIKKEGGGN
ncbi:MAG: AtpZ/AtpI family protein [Pseudomonadota bacterium]